MVQEEAYVTLVATDAYASGALVLSHRLRDLGSEKDIVCLVTPNISGRVIDLLSQVCSVMPVDTLRSTNVDNLNLLGRPDLDVTFTKIQLWRLTQYRKIVFLDADTYPLKNIDDLFKRPSSFSAAPDAGWPDCFNSGVFVTEPSESTFENLAALASEKGSFDGGDQGLLNTYFDSWSTDPSQKLPFTFNTTPTTQYGYAPAHNQFGHTISVLHFIGKNKPWKYQRFADGRILPLGGNAWEGLRDMVQQWWNTWDKYYGRTPPYHLLSGEFDTFDSGFQTEPIVPFDEPIKNAWDDQHVRLDDNRRKVQQMPPLENISISRPKWIPQEHEQKKHDHQTQEHVTIEHHQEESTHTEQHYHQEQIPPSEEHHEQHHEQHHQQPNEPISNSEEQSKEQIQKEKVYSMIEWDPAHQEPPKTVNVGADIPDLSSFKNMWDQPYKSQHKRIWVAPVHRPEPGIMKRHEYAHHNTEEYDSEHLYPQQQINLPSSHTTTIIEKQAPQQYHQEEHHEEHHQQEHHEEQPKEQQNPHYNYDPQYPPAFPWDNVPHHFPAPTRVWLDEQPVKQYNEPQQTEPAPVEEHLEIKEEKPEEKPEKVGHHHPNLHIDIEQPQITQVPKEWNRDSIIESPIREQRQESPHQDTQGLFAIDHIMTPSAQNKIDEFLAALNADDTDRFEITDRDLIPINFKSSSRLQTGMYTPSPLGSRNPSRSNSRNASRSNSRRPSLASSRRNSASAILVRKPSMDETEQPSKLFAAESSMYSRKTPYTSAAVTPAAIETPEALDRDTYFNEEPVEEVTEQQETKTEEKTDFLEPAQYAFIQQVEEPEAEMDDWDPVRALNKLKEQSESMVLRQSLHEALVKTAKEQENESELAELADEPVVIQPKKPTVFKSSWDDEEYDLPSGLVSGQSSPRTPVVRPLSSNLTMEIEMEKERHKQQRASLMLAQPQTAVASMLEAELDLSQGSLFKRRHDDLEHSSGGSNEIFAGQVPTGQNTAAFYDYSVVLEAQKKLKSLLSGGSEEVDADVIPIAQSKDNIPSSKASTRNIQPHVHDQSTEKPQTSVSLEAVKEQPKVKASEPNALEIFANDPSKDVATIKSMEEQETKLESPTEQSIPANIHEQIAEIFEEVAAETQKASEAHEEPTFSTEKSDTLDKKSESSKETPVIADNKEMAGLVASPTAIATEQPKSLLEESLSTQKLSSENLKSQDTVASTVPKSENVSSDQKTPISKNTTKQKHVDQETALPQVSKELPPLDKSSISISGTAAASLDKELPVMDEATIPIATEEDAIVSKELPQIDDDLNAKSIVVDKSLPQTPEIASNKTDILNEEPITPIENKNNTDVTTTDNSVAPTEKASEFVPTATKSSESVTKETTPLVVNKELPPAPLKTPRKQKSKGSISLNKQVKEKTSFDRSITRRTSSGRSSIQETEDKHAKEKTNAEKKAKEKANAEKIAKEKANAEKIAKEKALADKKALAEKIAKEKALADKKALAEKTALADKKAKEKAAADKKAKEQALIDKKNKEKAVAAEKKAIADKTHKEHALADKQAKEQALADKKVKEKAVAEKKAKEHALAEKKAKEQALAEKKAKEALAEKKAKEQALAEKKAKEALAEKKAKEQALAEKKAKEHALAEKKAKEHASAEKKAKENALAEKKAKEHASLHKASKEKLSVSHETIKESEKKKGSKSTENSSTTTKTSTKSEKTDQSPVRSSSKNLLAKISKRLSNTVLKSLPSKPEVTVDRHVQITPNITSPVSSAAPNLKFALERPKSILEEDTLSRSSSSSRTSQRSAPSPPLKSDNDPISPILVKSPSTLK